jgi:hypothetical protein
MERIRKVQLDWLLNRINELAGTPPAAYTRDGSGKLTGNIGHIFLDRGYGGYSIVQMVNEAGGQRNFGHPYRMSARETWMCLRGIEAALEFAKAGK